ncbi:hypothetical protein EVAR_74542_1 [Eumeta japonica]|uniref:Uncharacterized protein n=1 Tax=Eumeta variegata TaxID=151549 RepID=A0A4C1TBS2_EUMVA|nr:hypothetical protein EVAR_74542_1 [Eumeta japonica]
MQAPKRNRSARHEPVCMPISLTLSLSVSLSLLGGLTVLEWKGRVPFTFMSVSLLLGGLTMPEWKGRVPLTRSHCERITESSWEIARRGALSAREGPVQSPTRRPPTAPVGAAGGDAASQKCFSCKVDNQIIFYSNITIKAHNRLYYVYRSTRFDKGTGGGAPGRVDTGLGPAGPGARVSGGISRPEESITSPA